MTKPNSTIVSTFPLNRQYTTIVLPVVLSTEKISVHTHMLLDTGASYCLIKPEIADVLDLKPQETVTFQTANGLMSTHITHIPIVNCQHHTVEHVTTTIATLPTDAHIDGLLGLSFLRHFSVHLDFVQQLLTLTSSKN